MRKLWIAGIAIMLAIIVTAAYGDITGSTVKLPKQTGGGSTGDSLTAAADTSTGASGVGNKLPAGLKTLYVLAAADSQSIYTTQVSYEGTYWYTVDTDTVAAGAAELTADLGPGYGGMYLRVILEPITGACPYGVAVVNYTEEK